MLEVPKESSKGYGGTSSYGSSAAHDFSYITHSDPLPSSSEQSSAMVSRVEQSADSESIEAKIDRRMTMDEINLNYEGKAPAKAEANALQKEFNSKFMARFEKNFEKVKRISEKRENKVVIQ